jgi:hypothetical protein
MDAQWKQKLKEPYKENIELLGPERDSLWVNFQIVASNTLLSYIR